MGTTDVSTVDDQSLGLNDDEADALAHFDALDPPTDADGVNEVDILIRIEGFD